MHPPLSSEHVLVDESDSLVHIREPVLIRITRNRGALLSEIDHPRLRVLILAIEFL
jgi:hypothetical protein